MADLSDVANALAALIAGALYPNGTGAASVTGAPVKVFPGSPNSSQLDADLRAGAVNIAITTDPDHARNTSRYGRDWQLTNTTQPTVGAKVAGSTITFTGTVTAGNIVTVIIDNAVFSYSLLATDTLASLATALAVLVTANDAATVAGATITLPANFAGRIVARVGAPSTAVQEVRREQHLFKISVLAPTPALRVATATAFDAVLAGTDFLALPDGSTAWLVPQATNDTDTVERAGLYRRDILLWAEYAVIATANFFPVTAFQTGLETDPASSPDISAASPAPFTPGLAITS